MEDYNIYFVSPSSGNYLMSWDDEVIVDTSDFEQALKFTPQQKKLIDFTQKALIELFDEEYKILRTK